MRVTTLHSWFNANGKCCFSTYWHSAQSHANKFFFPVWMECKNIKLLSVSEDPDLGVNHLWKGHQGETRTHPGSLQLHKSKHIDRQLLMSVACSIKEFKACLQCRTDTLNRLDVSVFCRFITHQMSTKATQGGVWANQPAVTSPGWCVMHAAKTQALFENVMAAQLHCVFR